MAYKKRLFSLLALMLLLFGCGPASAPAAPSGPKEFKTYAHDLRYVQHDCVGLGMCVRYILEWPANVHVTLEMHAEGFRGALLLYRGNMLRAEIVQPGTDGVVRMAFDTSERTNVRILVAGQTRTDVGPTRLVVGPPPKEIELPAPPPSAEELDAARTRDDDAKRDEFTAAPIDALRAERCKAEEREVYAVVKTGSLLAYRFCDGATVLQRDGKTVSVKISNADSAAHRAFIEKEQAAFEVAEHNAQVLKTQATAARAAAAKAALERREAEFRKTRWSAAKYEAVVKKCKLKPLE